MQMRWVRIIWHLIQLTMIMAICSSSLMIHHTLWLMKKISMMPMMAQGLLTASINYTHPILIRLINSTGIIMSIYKKWMKEKLIVLKDHSACNNNQLPEFKPLKMVVRCRKILTKKDYQINYNKIHIKMHDHKNPHRIEMGILHEEVSKMQMVGIKLKCKNN